MLLHGLPVLLQSPALPGGDFHRGEARQVICSLSGET
jgi:hypothetical protein